MLRVVLDTNILVSGLLSAHGNPAQIVNALKSRRFHLFYSAEIVSEYRDVLYRARLGISAKDADALLEAILNIGFPVLPKVSYISLPDESDRVFYDTAKTARAYLVTGNAKHYPQEPFIVAPAQFLAIFKGA